MIETIKDTVIIGSGPAGYTAAIYAARANMNPVMFTGMQPGGQLTTTTDVENFPGYANGVTGPEMMEHLQKQAERFGTEIQYEYVTEVDLKNAPGQIHKVNTSSGNEIQARSIFIYTASHATYLVFEH